MIPTYSAAIHLLICAVEAEWSEATLYTHTVCVCVYVWSSQIFDKFSSHLLLLFNTFIILCFHTSSQRQRWRSVRSHCRRTILVSIHAIFHNVQFAFDKLYCRREFTKNDNLIIHSHLIVQLVNELCVHIQNRRNPKAATNIISIFGRIIYIFL